jgi:nicotinamidase-related amidase
MALTTLDPKTALVVIDLQNGIVSVPMSHPLDDVVKRPAANHRRAVTYATPCSAAHSFKFIPKSPHRALLSAIERLPRAQLHRAGRERLIECG